MRTHSDDAGRDVVPAKGTPATRGSVPAGHVALQLHERERARLSFDLHDGPAQAVAAALLQVRLLQDGDQAESAEGLAELQRLLASALEEMYLLIEQLHSRMPEGDGLAAQVIAQVDAFRARSGLPVALEVEGAEDGYSQSLRIAVCRIVQEALTNISRHADAAHVRVDLKLGPERVVCAVEDDGSGFDPSAARGAPGPRDRYGLDGMRERAVLLGGECVVTSAPGQGTRVALTVPVWRG